MKISKTAKIIGGLVLGFGAIGGGIIWYRSKQKPVQVDEQGNLVPEGGQAPGTGAGLEEVAKPEAVVTAPVDEVMRSVINRIKTYGDFQDIEKARHFFKNLDSTSETDLPSLDLIKAALKRSNLVYYNNEVSVRMTREEAWKYVKDRANMVSGKPVISFGDAGVYMAPLFNGGMTQGSMMFLLANGYWIAMLFNFSGSYSPSMPTTKYQTLGNNQYLIEIWDLWDTSKNTGAPKSPVAIPTIFKTDYSYGFDGNSKLIPDTFGTLSSEIF